MARCCAAWCCSTGDGAAVRVRPATEADYEVAGRICVAAYDAEHLIVGDYAGRLADVAGRAAHTDLLIAEDPATGAVLGSVTFVRPGTPFAEMSRPDEAEFRMLAVDPAAQGRGVGTALALACLDRAAALGYAAVVICTRPVSAPALAVYARLGFVRVPERDFTPEPGLVLIALRATVRPR